jgi:hypothetical protein
LLIQAIFTNIYSENLTGPTRLAQLSGLGSAVTYNTNAGGTLPTDQNGIEGISLATIAVDADFLAQQITRIDLSVSVGTQSYANLGISNNIAFDQLYRQSTGISELTAPSCGGSQTACGGDISLQFIGPNAEAIMVSYGVGEPDGSAGINGSNLIKR